MNQNIKPKHEIGDLVMRRHLHKKNVQYILGVIKNHRTKNNGHGTAYPWGVYWIDAEIITSDGCKYYTAGEITRFKNTLNDYINNE